MINTITFDESAKKLILKVLGLIPDKSGYLINIKTKKRFKDKLGDLHINNFAGVYKRRIIRADIASLIELSDELKQDELNTAEKP